MRYKGIHMLKWGGAALALAVATSCIVGKGSIKTENSNFSASRYWDKHFVGSYANGGKQYDCYGLVLYTDLTSLNGRKMTSAWIGAASDTPGARECRPPEYPTTTTNCKEAGVFKPEYNGFSLGEYKFLVCDEERVALVFPPSYSPGAELRWDPKKPVNAEVGRRLVFATYSAVPKGAPPPKWRIAGKAGIRTTLCAWWGCYDDKLDTF